MHSCLTHRVKGQGAYGYDGLSSLCQLLPPPSTSLSLSLLNPYPSHCKAKQITPTRTFHSFPLPHTQKKLKFSSILSPSPFPSHTQLSSINLRRAFSSSSSSSPPRPPTPPPPPFPQQQQQQSPSSSSPGSQTRFREDERPSPSSSQQIKDATITSLTDTKEVDASPSPPPSSSSSSPSSSTPSPFPRHPPSSFGSSLSSSRLSTSYDLIDPRDFGSFIGDYGNIIPEGEYQTLNSTLSLLKKQFDMNVVLITLDGLESVGQYSQLEFSAKNLIQRFHFPRERSIFIVYVKPSERTKHKALVSVFVDTPYENQEIELKLLLSARNQQWEDIGKIISDKLEHPSADIDSADEMREQIALQYRHAMETKDYKFLLSDMWNHTAKPFFSRKAVEDTYGEPPDPYTADPYRNRMWWFKWWILYLILCAILTYLVLKYYYKLYPLHIPLAQRRKIQEVIQRSRKSMLTEDRVGQLGKLGNASVKYSDASVNMAGKVSMGSTSLSQVDNKFIAA